MLVGFFRIDAAELVGDVFEAATSRAFTIDRFRCRRETEVERSLSWPDLVGSKKGLVGQLLRKSLESAQCITVPWDALIALIEPFYPKTSKKGGRPPYPLATMLRVHLLQQWYSLSDPAMEEALIEVPTMRRFAGIELISDRIPDETTILTFRHLLEKHGLGEQFFETVIAHLSARGMTMRQGTIVDATLIAAPSSTSTRAKPECAGGERTKRGDGIRRCTRPRKVISGISG
jgi:transposase, IS5 family